MVHSTKPEEEAGAGINTILVNDKLQYSLLRQDITPYWSTSKLFSYIFCSHGVQDEVALLNLNAVIVFAHT